MPGQKVLIASTEPYIPYNISESRRTAQAVLVSVFMFIYFLNIIQALHLSIPGINEDTDGKKKYLRSPNSHIDGQATLTTSGFEDGH